MEPLSLPANMSVNLCATCYLDFTWKLLEAIFSALPISIIADCIAYRACILF